MNVRKLVTQGFVPILLLSGVAGTNCLNASLVFDGVASGKGAGIGGSNVILTIQHTGTESGCVSFTGTTSIVGSAACTAGYSGTTGITGGDEKTGSSQTQTQLISSTGVVSAQSLVVILNINQPAGGPVVINNVSLSIFSPTGVVLYNSGNLVGAPVSIDSSAQGQGNLGFAFVLDPNTTNFATVNSFICSAASANCGTFNAANANNRFGLAATLSNASGSNEVLSIADFTGVTIAAPEPLTVFTSIGGLALLAFASRFRRTRRNTTI